MADPTVAGVDLIDLLAREGVTTLVVGGTSVVYSKSVPMPFSDTFGIEYNVTSPGTIDVKVELEQGNQLPATEGAADANWAVTQTLETSLADGAVRFKALSPIVTKFMRLKLTGQGLNNASTALEKLRIAFVPQIR